MTDGSAGTVITGQIETVMPGPSGRFEPVIRVSFRTPSGAIGSVDVPVASFSVDAVREAVQQRAATMEAVANLQIT